MNPQKLLGVILLILGTLALAYRGFSYTRETHDAKLGPLEFSIKEKERVDIPTWAGVAAIVVGGGLLLVGRSRAK